MARKNGHPRVTPDLSHELSSETFTKAEPLNYPRRAGKTYLGEAGWMTRNGLIYTPVIFERQIGYKVYDPERERTEYTLLNPTDDHEVNVDNGALGDTFVYHLDAEATAEWQAAPDDGTVSPIDFADPVTYVNHFQGTITPDDLDPEAL